MPGPHVHGRLVGSAPARADHMGVVLDLISLTVAGGLSAAQLAVAVSQWRAARRAAPAVTIRHGDVEIDVRSGDAATALAIAELLREQAHGGQQGDDRGTA
ncbi:effector-associated constant component EACC1 [Streptomyces sp. OZ13]|uniref:effector-associated constant component EACC1 n=1 Tax=Streptomyces sp. OZ13 TaxID=3452210 RepID=UPI003F8A6464